MNPIRLHLFVCQNRRPVGSRPSCGGRGSQAVLQALQVQALALGGEVAVTGCQCLGPCFDGPMLVVYPENVWYRGVLAADVEEIVQQHLRGGQPVERLRYRWPLDPPGDPT